MQPGASRVSWLKRLLIVAAFAVASLAHADDLTTPRNDALVGAALDCGSTVIGIWGYELVEKNPLADKLGSVPKAIAIGCIAKAAMIYAANQQPEPIRTNGLSMQSAGWAAAGAHNLVMLPLRVAVLTGKIAASAASGIGWAFFVGTAVYVWHQTAPQREFASLCATLRKANPAMQCKFEKPAVTSVINQP